MMMKNNPYQLFQPIPHPGPESSPPTTYPLPSAASTPPPPSSATPPSSTTPYVLPPSSAIPTPPPSSPTPYPPPSSATPYDLPPSPATPHDLPPSSTTTYPPPSSPTPYPPPSSATPYPPPSSTTPYDLPPSSAIPTPPPSSPTPYPPPSSATPYDLPPSFSTSTLPSSTTTYPPHSSPTPYPPPSSATPYPPPSSATPYPPPSSATPYPPPSSATPYPPPSLVLTDDRSIHAQQYPATAANDSFSGGGIAVGTPNHQYYYTQSPYIQQVSAQEPYKNTVHNLLNGFDGLGSKVEKAAQNTVHTVLKSFSSWTSKAEKSAQNVLHNLKTGASVSGTAWGKVSLRAKVMTQGGFEELFKQTFATFPQETLQKTFACHLSTSIGPVAGTLYLSDLHVAFCNDYPLSFKDPFSGQKNWSYYKVMLPLGKITAINPVINKEKSSDKCILISTFDGQEFRFIGFVNHKKASNHLIQSISSFSASEMPVHEQPS